MGKSIGGWMMVDISMYTYPNSFTSYNIIMYIYNTCSNDSCMFQCFIWFLYVTQCNHSFWRRRICHKVSVCTGYAILRKVCKFVIWINLQGILFSRTAFQFIVVLRSIANDGLSLVLVKNQRGNLFKLCFFFFAWLIVVLRPVYMSSRILFVWPENWNMHFRGRLVGWDQHTWESQPPPPKKGNHTT